MKNFHTISYYKKWASRNNLTAHDLMLHYNLYSKNSVTTSNIWEQLRDNQVTTEELKYIITLN